MLTEKIIHKHQDLGNLDPLFDDCFCGGGDFGVYRKGDSVYKVHYHDSTEVRSLHPDTEILADLKGSEFFPKLLGSGPGYVSMTYEKGIPLDEYELDNETAWTLPLIKKAVSDVIHQNYIPYELEPRHVLVNEETRGIKVIDVTAYIKMTPEQATNTDKKELLEDWIFLFKK